MASPASYTSIACLGLSPKCHPSLQHLSALRSHGASSSPRIQTERLLPSPPRPTPLPLSTAQMGVPRCPNQTGQSHPGQSHHPLLLMTPGQSPSPAPSLPHAPPPCHVHLPVSPGQLSVSQDRPTVTPVPAFCESHLRPVLPTPRRPVSVLYQMVFLKCSAIMQIFLKESTVDSCFFLLRTMLMYTGALDLPFTSAFSVISYQSPTPSPCMMHM